MKGNGKCAIEMENVPWIFGKLSYQGRKVLKPNLDLAKSETVQENGEKQGQVFQKQRKHSADAGSSGELRLYPDRKRGECPETGTQIRHDDRGESGGIRGGQAQCINSNYGNSPIYGREKPSETPQDQSPRRLRAKYSLCTNLGFMTRDFVLRRPSGGSQSERG